MSDEPTAADLELQQTMDSIRALGEDKHTVQPDIEPETDSTEDD